MIVDRIYTINEITPENDRIKPIKNWKTQLKRHQLALIYRCIDLENTGIHDDFLNSKYASIKSNIGIIGDKVGSGKTYSVLGLIKSNIRPQIKFKQTHMFGYNNINVELKDRTLDYDYISTNIIVVPHGIIKQWENCINETDLSYFIVNSTKTLSNLSIELEKNRNILLVSGTFFRKVESYITSSNFIMNRVIFDEVDSMNTPSAKHIPALFYWFVSASYKNILNPYPRWNYEYNNYANTYMISSGISNNMYVKNIFMNIHKARNNNLAKIVDKIVMKNSDEHVEMSFSLPEITKHITKCRDSGLINILLGVVHSNIIQSLNAGDVVTAMSYINSENIDTESNIIKAVQKGLNIKLNNINAEIRYVNDTLYVNENIKQKKLEKLSNEKAVIEQKMTLIHERIHTADMCSICINSYSNKCITKCCSNSFCMKCITSWLNIKNTCPICKSCMNIKNDLYIVNDESLCSGVKHEYPTKLSALQNIIEKKDTKMKMLIFSEYENSFIEIEKLLTNLSKKYSKLKGNGISHKVDQYKNGDLEILLMNSSSYGSGINLENTTDVVLFHKFDNDLETQVIGRAQRPGRENSLNVYYLLNTNEMKTDDKHT